MRFTIADVGHGFCAYLRHDNGNVMVWDCGHKSEPENRPSQFLRAEGINVVHRFLVTNYDEDHISDLPNLRESLKIKILQRNKSITPAQLRKLKSEAGPISSAMNSLLEMMQRYTAEVTTEPSFPDVEYTTFFHKYREDFEDTNNISLVTFLKTPDLSVIIPGDIEKPAWEKHLRNKHFCRNLRETNVFVASHHGRESGYCEQVFDYCRPSVIIFSDGPKKYATQEMVEKYANHASGVQFNGRTRYVLTTRRDGTFGWGSL